MVETAAATATDRPSRMGGWADQSAMARTKSSMHDIVHHAPQITWPT